MQNQIVSFISETAIHYRDSSIVTDAGGSGNLRAGDRMPNPEVTLANGTQQALLAPLTRPQHLLITQHIPDPTRLASSPRDVTLVELAPQQLSEVAEHFDSEAGMWLVRPDGYLGFRGGQDAERALVDYARSVGIAVL
jgi:hypothetical protein